MPDERRLEEQALSKVAETLLSSQVDTAKEIDVDVRTDLIKTAQGEVDSITIEGKEVVTQQDLHVQEMEIRTDRVAINLLDALFGKIELNQPINSTGRFVVTEANINQNLNSDYIRSNLPPLELNVDGQIVSLKFQSPMELHLPGEGKMVFSSNVQVSEKGKTQQVGFTGVMYPRTHEHPISIEGFSFKQGQALPLEVMVAFMEKMEELVNLPYLEFNGTAFRISEMEVEKGSINLEIEAHTTKLPSS